jgi:hypothetical protein
MRCTASVLISVGSRGRSARQAIDLPVDGGVILGRGEVVAVGDRVQRVSVGDRVLGRVDMDRRGAFAERAAVGEDFAAHMPLNLDFEAAAGVPPCGTDCPPGVEGRTWSEAGAEGLTD